MAKITHCLAVQNLDRMFTSFQPTSFQPLKTATHMDLTQDSCLYSAHSRAEASLNE